MRMIFGFLAGVIVSGATNPIEVRAGKADAPTVLLVSDSFAREEAERYARVPEVKRGVRLLAIVVPMERVAFPPRGKAYRDDPEAHAIWRFLTWSAPDLVLVAGDGATGLPGRRVDKRAGLIAGLASVTRVARPARSPIDVAKSLGSMYGQDFEEPVYIPAMALIGRIRLGQVAEVERLVAPFADARKDSLAKVTSSHFAGHLVFAELAERPGKREYIDLVRRAADAVIASDALNNEMSDSVFMGCPILVKAGKLTGQTKYFDAAVRHFQRMQALCRRADGLYRHSPLTEAAWGRGNAFVALGLALSMEDLQSREMLAAYQDLMTKLATFQDSFSGMFHQVIDVPESYGELSATAMIGRAMQIGIRKGWLERARFQPVVDAAWRGVSARTFDYGVLMDVCESTGKQKSLQDYLDREAIWGRDARGGGMVLLFALEIASARQGTGSRGSRSPASGGGQQPFAGRLAR